MNTSAIQNFHSHGKLLLTAEFLVIDGAQALAAPCQYGQSLQVEKIEEPEIIWHSFTDEGKLWYEGIFSITNTEITNTYSRAKKGQEGASQWLEVIFKALRQLNPTLFQKGGMVFNSRLEFPQSWGLGSSSTLLSNLAAWAEVNPFELSDLTFGGSAYDLACARAEGPILFTRTDPKQPRIEHIDFNPTFKEHLFFVHRNQKQNTREVVAHYKALNPGDKQQWVKEATQLTQAFVNCTNLQDFNYLIEVHEGLLSKVLAMLPVKQTHFSDYPHAIKSLGAWGGDFMLAVGGAEERAYFESRGYTTIVEYRDMLL